MTDSLVEIVSAETAIGRLAATARRLVNGSVSDNTRRAYAGALAVDSRRDQIGRAVLVLPRPASTNDPTAHAEITAIRHAGRVLGTFDLSGYELYASCEPCPMCLAAIYWARLDRVSFANTRADAAPRP